MLDNQSRGNILVAPLNWGLGHATRCIPIIRALLENNYNPILASDGIAFDLLGKEFPDLQLLELPSYEIEYPKDGANFKWKMLKNTPKMIEAVRAEKKLVKQWVKEMQLTGIISDNRLGVVSKKIPSIFMTHQINVLTGNTSWLSGMLHRLIIKKFAECWVPDVDTFQNLTGKLGHLTNPGFDIKYIGPLSRFEKKSMPMKYDLMVILSGPEPQRGILDTLLQSELREYEGNVVFIQGIVESQQTVRQIENVTYYNYMTSAQLEDTFNQSQLILCRSGYTTIMDLAKLGKKAFFIPTPGQYEQEYLAKRLHKKGIIPYSKQDVFRIDDLKQSDLYNAIPTIESEIHWKNLFCIFESQ